MNLKKLSLAALSLTLTAGLLAGCTNAGAGTTPPSEKPAAGTAVKTGLSVMTDISDSKSVGDKDGQAAVDIALVAVTVGDDGVIDSCAIDAIQPKISFNAAGELTIDPATLFESKNELGQDYGMHKASSIQKEWNEQAAAFAAYAVGKTVEELKSMEVDDTGKAADVDLVSSCTLTVNQFIPGIEAAVNNATHLGAQKGDKLALTATTNMAKSKNATAEKDGVAQAYATMSAVTLNGDTVTSCYIDAVQANVNFNAAGEITTDLTAPVQTKNELGEDYGMKGASSIGKEWNEQAAAFAAFVTGKTQADVAGIAAEDGKTTDVDLVSSCTVGITEFQELVAKAGK